MGLGSSKLNVISNGGGSFDVESESTPGKYYTVQTGQAAKKAGVPYSCPCPSWVNNTRGDRTCKHTDEVQSFVTGKIVDKFSGIRPPQRGRPGYSESERCPKCRARTRLMKATGVCNKCGYSEDKKKAKSFKERAEKEVIITNETVRVEKDAMSKVMEELGI